MSKCEFVGNEMRSGSLQSITLSAKQTSVTKSLNQLTHTNGLNIILLLKI